MVIRQMNDIFTAMLQHGMQKQEMPFETLYTAIDGYGSGYARTTGRMDWWYYLDMNFYSKAAYELEYHVEEPHIVIGLTDEISYEYRRQPDTSVHPYENAFFINVDGMYGTLRHEAGSWLRRRCIIIQPSAYAENLFPALMNHPSNDMLSLIRDAGAKCGPYIARAITALRITDYEGQSLLMQINTLVMGLFTEIIHQANLLHDPGDKRINNQSDITAIRQAQKILRENLKEVPTVEDLSRRVAMNRKKLQALFQQTTGMTIGDYTRACRMERAMELLGTDMLIRDISHEVGYASPGRFSKAFEAMYHMTPTEYRESLIHAGHPSKMKL